MAVNFTLVFILAIMPILLAVSAFFGDLKIETTAVLTASQQKVFDSLTYVLFAFPHAIPYPGVILSVTAENQTLLEDRTRSGFNQIRRKADTAKQSKGEGGVNSRHDRPTK